jgi:hypothetical protein
VTAPTPHVIDQLASQAVEMLQHNPPCPMNNVKGHAPHLNHCEMPNMHTGQPNRRCLACEYKWVAGIVSSRRVRDTAKTMRTYASDPTGEFAVSRSEVDVKDGAVDPEGVREQRRRDVERKLVKVRDALDTMIAQRKILEDFAASFVGGSGPEEKFAAKSSMLMPDELEASREAKRKRQERGEGFGSS